MIIRTEKKNTRKETNWVTNLPGSGHAPVKKLIQWSVEKYTIIKAVFNHLIQKIIDKA